MIETSELEALRLSSPGPYRAGERIDCLWLVRNFGEEPMSGSTVYVDHSEGVNVSKGSVEGAGFSASSDGDLTAAAPALLEALAPAESRWLRFGIEVGTVRTAQLGMRMRLENGTELRSETAVLEVLPEVSIEIEPPKAYCLKADPQRVGLKIAVINRGSIDDDDAKLTIPLPTGARIEKAHVDERFTISSAGARYEVRLPTLAAGSRTEFGFLVHVGDDQRGDEFTLSGLRYESSSIGVIEVEPQVIALEPDVRIRAILETTSAKAVPGETLQYALSIINEGRSEARNVRAAIALPDALVYAAGTLSVGGVTDNRFDDTSTIRIERIAPRSKLVVKCAATVRSPVRAALASVFATVNGRDVEAVQTEITAAPSFPAFANYVTTNEPLLLRAGDRRKVRIAVENRGAVSATDVRVVLGPTTLEICDAVRTSDGRAEPTTIEEARREDTGSKTYKIPIGELAPGARNAIAISLASTSATVDDGSHERLNVRVVANGLESRLGTLAYEIDQGAGLTTDLEIAGNPRELHPSDDITIVATMTNSAARTHEHISLRFDLPSWFSVESIDGSDFEGPDEVVVRTVEPFAQRRVAITGRVHRMTSRRQPFAVGLSVRHRGNVERVRIFPIDVVATSDLRSSTLSVAAAQGYLADVAIEVLNTGNGPAEQVMVSADTSAFYVPNSTSIDGTRMGDVAGHSMLTRGFALPMVDAGQTIRLGFQIRLTAQAVYEPNAVITYGREEARVTLSQAPFRIDVRPQLAPRPIATERAEEPNGNATEMPPRKSPIAIFKRRERVTPTAGSDASIIDPRITVVPDATDEVESVPEPDPFVVQPTIISDDEFLESMYRRTAGGAPTPPASSLRLIGEPEQDQTPLQTPVAETSPKLAVTSTQSAPAAEFIAFEPALPAIVTANEGRHEERLATRPVEEGEGEHRNAATLVEPPAAQATTRDPRPNERATATPTVDVVKTVPAKLEFASLTGVVVVDTQWIARAKAVFARIDARPEMGWFRHAIALRIFAPTVFLGGSEALDAIWSPIAAALEGDLRKPVMRTIIASWTPNDEWIRLLELDTYEAVDALQEALRDVLAKPRASSYEPHDRCLYGVIGRDQLEYVTGQTGSLGILDALLTDMIPTASPSLDELARALAAWREPVSETFTTIALAGGRSNRMRTARKPSLDRLLDDVSAAVRRLERTQ